MKPFLLVGTRADDALADAEAEAFTRLAGLPADGVHRVRLEQGPLPVLDLDAFSGVIVGGSPFNVSDPDEAKSAVQRRVEADLFALLEDVLAREIPFFGACYGIGLLGTAAGGTVDRRDGESVGAIEVSVTDAGRADPLFGAMPARFTAYVGHKEACRELPPDAVLLATGTACRVQAFRLGRNAYATQFHPELDVDGLIERIRAYRHEGYFQPEETDALIETARTGVPVTEVSRLLRRFVELHGRR